MLNLLRYLKKKDWALILVCILLIVAQVYLELKMPDYTKALTTIVQSDNVSMSKVWENRGFYTQLYNSQFATIG